MTADPTNVGAVADEPDRELAFLLGRVARGDGDAYASLYDHVAPAIFGLALRVTNGDRSAAEEIVQEAMLEVWRSADRFDAGRGSVMTWVLTFAHRRAVDRVRRDRSHHDRVRKAEQYAGPEAIVGDPTESVEAEEITVRVRRALSGLPAMQREALELAYFGGHTYPEVAATLGVPLGTVKTRIRQGMIRLRERLEDSC